MTDSVIADIEAIRARAKASLDGAQGYDIAAADEEVKQLARDILVLLEQPNPKELKEIVELRVALMDLKEQLAQAQSKHGFGCECTRCKTDAWRDS